VSDFDAEPIDRTQLHVWNWDGVNIQREITAPGADLSVFDRVKASLRETDAEVVFCDHGAGEIADFVSLKRTGDTLAFTLHHCKGSAGPTPGARVEDVYEVCGQAQKSVVWRSLARMRRRVASRLADLELVRGTREDLQRLLEKADSLRQRFEIVVVQPGISAASLSGALAETLGATSDHITRAGFKKLRVVVSA